MAIKVDDILKRTVVYINEYSADMADPDAFGAEARADLLAHIDAAARMVAQVAPANMQEAKTLNSAGDPPNFNVSTTVRPDGRRVLTAQLPPDYMRLVYLTADELFRPITVLLPSTHPTYAMQYCPIAGIGAGAYAPIGYQVDGILEVHSLDNVNVNDNENQGGNQEEETVAVKMQYLCVPTVEAVTVSEQTYDAYKTLKAELKDVIAMQAAALYLGMNESEKASLAQQMATGMLNTLIVKADNKG